MQRTSQDWGVTEYASVLCVDERILLVSFIVCCGMITTWRNHSYCMLYTADGRQTDGRSSNILRVSSPLAACCCSSLSTLQLITLDLILLYHSLTIIVTSVSIIVS
mmetsp:Transcript_22836/g.34603  ORF Transcript_22836/g.34603 Transcript_22836/m.34603 type:complete len:106 (-) Transcript_22836:413-730(-)